MASFKKLMSDYGLGVIIILLLVAFAISTFSDYLTNKALGGSEGMGTEIAHAYGDGSTIIEDSPEEQIAASSAPVDTADSGDKTVQDPTELLPKDEHNQFSELAPSTSNSGLLSAGHHIGIGGSEAPLRNSNLQLRGEDPNPRTYVGPWNQSTIEGDQLRKGICA